MERHARAVPLALPVDLQAYLDDVLLADALETLDELYGSPTARQIDRIVAEQTRRRRYGEDGWRALIERALRGGPPGEIGVGEPPRQRRRPFRRLPSPLRSMWLPD
jgi:hypothetical protein